MNTADFIADQDTIVGQMRTHLTNARHAQYAVEELQRTSDFYAMFPLATQVSDFREAELPALLKAAQDKLKKALCDYAEAMEALTANALNYQQQPTISITQQIAA